MSIKISTTFLIWVAAAVLFTLTAVGGHGFAGTWIALSPEASLPNAVSTSLDSGPIAPVHARPPVVTDKLSAVVTAFQAGNVEELSRYFDTYVDLTLPDKRVGSCSRSQAKMVLRDFFETYKVKSFNIQVKGEGESTGYCIGTLQTASGNFRTTLFVRQEGEQSLLKEINMTAR
jgi:hypothetical protein